MDTVVLAAVRRPRLGTKYTRRVRHAGKTPAIIYGHGEAPEAIALETHDVEVALVHHSRLLTMDLEGQRLQLLLKAVQFDHLGTHPIHLDLVRVALDERVTVSVDVQLKGTARGLAEGGVITQLLNSVELECLVTAIPDSLRVSVAGLGVGEFLLVKDLEVPEGATILAAPDEKVVMCRVPTEEAEPVAEVAAEGEGAAEPEVISKGKVEGAEEEA